jgi:hypothetical protein
MDSITENSCLHVEKWLSCSSISSDLRGCYACLVASRYLRFECSLSGESFERLDTVRPKPKVWLHENVTGPT